MQPGLCSLMTTAGPGASACRLALLSTNLACLQLSRYTSKPLPWLTVVVPLLCCLVREGPAAKPCLPRVSSLSAGDNSELNSRWASKAW